MCDGLVWLTVSELSPKFHVYCVALPVVVFVKLTLNGATPLFVDTEKFATGAEGLLTLICRVTLLSPPGPLTVSLTV